MGWWKDAWELTKATFDSSYVPEEYRKPIPPPPPVVIPPNATDEQKKKVEEEAKEARRKQLKELSDSANAFNASIQSKAAGAETIMVTTGQTLGATGGFLIGLKTGNPIIGATMGWDGTGMLFDKYLTRNGGPPARTLARAYSPVPEDCGVLNPVVDAAEIVGVDFRSNKQYNVWSGPGATPLEYRGEEQRIQGEIMKEKLKLISRDGSGNVVLADLDRDGDGMLTEKDLRAIRNIFANHTASIFDGSDKQLADNFINELRSEGITFENQSVATLQAEADAKTVKEMKAHFDAALKRLSADGSSNITLADLDRDKDGVLTQKDAAAIKQVFGNEELAQSFLTDLNEGGITFNNQSIKELGPTAGSTPVVSSGLSEGGRAPSTRGGASKSFLSKIWESITGFFKGILNMFTKSSKSITPPGEPTSAGVTASGGFPAEFALPRGLPHVVPQVKQKG